MRTPFKIALAGGAGAALLLGSAGTLSYWNDQQSLPATGVTSGNLALSAPSCGSWTLDGTTNTSFNPASDLLVPGDVLTRTCTTTITATGKHIAAALTYGTATKGTGNLANELTYAVDFAVGANPAPAVITDADDQSVVTATQTVTFTGSSATNASRNLSAALNAITISAVQSHDPS